MLVITFLVGCVSLFLLLLHIHLYFQRRKLLHLPQFPIPLTPRWFFGHTPKIQEIVREFSLASDDTSFDFSKVFTCMGEQLNADTYAMFIFTRSHIYTTRIPVIAKVMSDHKTFLKRPAGETKLGYVDGARIFGDRGILVEQGTAIWYHKRKMMDPAFQKRFLKDLTGDMETSANKMCSYIEQHQEAGKIEMYGLLGRVALEIICTCGFNFRYKDQDFIFNPESDFNIAVSGIFEVLSLASLKMADFWVPWKYREAKARLHASTDLIRSTMKKHFDKRLEELSSGSEQTDNPCILDHIIRANDISGKINIDDVIDDFFTFLIAGMETTAITMACLVWELLKDKETTRKLKAELDGVYGDKSELDYEDLAKLVYLEQCIKECLRLHPPAQITSRVSPLTDEVVEGLFIPKETVVIVPTEAIQHSPAHWPEPLKFDPDRFAPNKKIVQFTYTPFSAGPRHCIGKHFAMMEAKLVMAKLYKTFDLFDPYPEETKLVKLVTLTSKPKHVYVGVAR